MKQKRRQKMWQEFKVLILASVGLKRHKKGSKEIKSRRHSCPPEQRVRTLAEGEEEKLYESLNPMNEMQSDSDEMAPEDDTLTDLNHAAAKHKIAIKPNNRRTPSRLTGTSTSENNANIPGSPEEELSSALSRSASLSSLDFMQDCHALLKTKSHSFKALPTILLLDDLDSNNIDQQSSRMGPNVIMVRTLPHMKLTVTEEQQEKFRLSIANWCLANEGLRKSIQSLQPPPSLNNNPTLSLMSSESLASICSGLQAIDKFDGGGNNCSHMEKMKQEESKTESQEIQKESFKRSELVIEDKANEEKSNTNSFDNCCESLSSSIQDSNASTSTCTSFGHNSDTKDDDDLEEDLTLEDTDDGLMNVNVKERRQYLLEMLNNAPVIKPRFTNGTLDPKATMSRIAAKNAAIVKMAVQNLDNLSTENNNNNNLAAEINNVIHATSATNNDNLETASLIAIEAANKVKMMVSKFDNSSNAETIQKV